MKLNSMNTLSNSFAKYFIKYIKYYKTVKAKKIRDLLKVNILK